MRCASRTGLDAPVGQLGGTAGHAAAISSQSCSPSGQRCSGSSIVSSVTVDTDDRTKPASRSISRSVRTSCSAVGGAQELVGEQAQRSVRLPRLRRTDGGVVEHELPERVAGAEHRLSARRGQFEVPDDERTEAIDRFGLLVDHLAEYEHAALQRLLEHRLDQGVLALEELVERVQRQLRPRDDLLDRELETAAFGDQVECRVDQERGAMLCAARAFPMERATARSRRLSGSASDRRSECRSAERGHVTPPVRGRSRRSRRDVVRCRRRLPARSSRRRR